MSDQNPQPTGQLTVVSAAKPPRISASVAASIVVPVIVPDAGDHAARRFLEFFAATIREGDKTPLFRSAAGRTGTLTEKSMNRIDAWRMIQRRAADVGTQVKVGCHTFRATGITA
jgi:hypothetical protein